MSVVQAGGSASFAVVTDPSASWPVPMAPVPIVWGVDGPAGPAGPCGPAAPCAPVWPRSDVCADFDRSATASVPFFTFAEVTAFFLICVAPTLFFGSFVTA